MTEEIVREGIIRMLTKLDCAYSDMTLEDQERVSKMFHKINRLIEEIKEGEEDEN